MGDKRDMALDKANAPPSSEGAVQQGPDMGISTISGMALTKRTSDRRGVALNEETSATLRRRGGNGTA